MIYWVDRIRQRRNCKIICQGDLFQFMYFIMPVQDAINAPKAIYAKHYVNNIDEIWFPHI